MRFVSRQLLAVMLLLASSAPMAQTIVTRCTQPSGHAYYFATPLAGNEKTGWITDGIKSGEFLLIKKGETDFDIIFKDVTSKTQSASDTGGTLVVVSKGIGHLVLLVGYSGNSIETWHFNIDDSGRGEVLLSQSRYGGVFQKASLMRAACSRQ